MLPAYEAEIVLKKTSKRPPKSNRAKKRPTTRTRKQRPARKRQAPVVDAEVVEAAPDSVQPPEGAVEPAVVLETPEPGFTSRVLPPEPERPFPSARRAIFFDVENASRPEHIARVIDHLAVDRMGRRTDFVAVGNWRVIGHDTARLLARHGANLVHSAPSTGVRDWSDLRIAVAAGVWLASARPGDVLEIVTNDRAFDAVGDVAASLGIAFRRLSHQGLAGVSAEVPAPVREVVADAHARRRGRGRRRGGWRERPPSAHHERARPQPAPPPEPPPEPVELPVAAEATEVPEVPPHTAPHDEIINVVRALMERAPGRPVTLDSLANALKARGFSRPPGSPRLITRLRRIKELNLSRSGVITLYGAGHPAAGHAAAGEREPEPEPAVAAIEPEVEAAQPEAEPAEPEIAGVAPPAARAEPAAVVEEEEEGPGPGNEALPVQQPSRGAAPSRRRRPRRGGRGRPRYSEPARAV
jgi:hypothetical protein